MDTTLPKEDNIVIEFSKTKDPTYKKKLEASYEICLYELCEPCENWEDQIKESKFIMNSDGTIRDNHVFIMDKDDDIITNIPHSYIFKRSHFYVTFEKQSSRLKRDLIKCWKERGYFINLFKDDLTGKWCLKLYWKSKN